jgi:hypothetical protein
MSANWHVGGSKTDGWTVTSPGGTTWSGAPSQPAAFNLAQSLAGIDAMLARINRPQLAVVPDTPSPPPRRAYYFGPVRQQQ